MLKQIFGVAVVAVLILGASAVVAQTAVTASIDAPANGATVTVGTPVTFNGSATGGATPYSFVWTFGDATSAFGETFVKTYTATGTMTVRLTVNDHNAVEDETIITVNVVAGEADPLTISNISITDITKTSAVIHWTTNRVATSRVIYDTVSHPDISGETGPNYGYANSTGTSDTDPKVTEHSVSVTGLTADTQYYFRVISEE